MGVLIGLAKDDGPGIDAIASRWCPLGVIKVILIDRKDVPAESRHGLELDGRCQAPGLAVMACGEEEALPGPAGARKAVHALDDRQAASE